jgi:hypothetical protein
VQVAGVAQHRSARAHADARLVHHVEHIGQALVRLADQVADGAALALRFELAFAEVEQAVTGATVTHLVVQARQHHVVALAQGAVVIDQELGHDEQRNAFHAGDQLAVRAGDLGQHQVHDIAGQIVLAGRDPHLVAGQAVLALSFGAFTRIGFRAGGDVGQAGTGLRLGQAHGAEIAPLEHRLHETAHLLGCAGLEQGVGIADGEEQIGRGGHVGRGEVSRQHLLHRDRQLHAAQIVILAGRHQAGADVGIQRSLHLGDDLHFQAMLARHGVRFFLVALLVVGREQVGGDLLGGVDGGVEGLAAVVLEARPLVQRFHVQPLIQ